MFQEILVVDYVTDFSELTQGQIVQLASNLVDSHFLSNCPNGTVIGIQISRGSTGRKKIYFPFFSHISMPVKSGERAWVFEQGNGLPSYWLSRKVQNRAAEDLNFTHDDRARLYAALSGQENRREAVTQTFYDENVSGAKLANIRKGSISRQEFIGEPVVAIKSKSVDLSIQGSNNTAIRLGDNGSKLSGTIDIVAGISTTSGVASSLNSDGYTETLKPITGIKLEDQLAGDLSPSDDARIVVSQNFNADLYYQIAGGDSGIQPTISLAADSVRVVAKNDLKIMVGSSTDPTSIILKNNGDIIITPSSLGVIKLGGEDASGAILATPESIVTAGVVTAPAIVDTAGGILGVPGIPASGVFATKVLVKV